MRSEAVAELHPNTEALVAVFSIRQQAPATQVPFCFSIYGMKCIIKEKMFDEFAPIIGVIVAQEVVNKDTPKEVWALLKKEEGGARKKFAAENTLGRDPFITAWRRAYKKFGSDPHQYRSSSEALLRRVLKGNSLPSVNTLVDLYNLISIKYVLPVGGEDRDALKGNLYLCHAQGSEGFVRLGGTENEPPEAGEVVYKDEEGVVCRRWNWREADRTKLTIQTRNAVIVVDGLAEIGRDAVEKATDELAALITRYCGGRARTEILEVNKREMVLR